MEVLGNLETIANTRHHVDFAPRTLPTIEHFVTKCHKCCFEAGLIFHCTSAELLAVPLEISARSK